MRLKPQPSPGDVTASPDDVTAPLSTEWRRRRRRRRGLKIAADGTARRTGGDRSAPLVWRRPGVVVFDVDLCPGVLVDSVDYAVVGWGALGLPWTLPGPPSDRT